MPGAVRCLLAALVKRCIYKVKALSVLWSQTTSTCSNDLIFEALIPGNVIVYDSGSFGGVGGAPQEGVKCFW